MAEHTDDPAWRRLRLVGWLFLAALLFHGFDHARRGFDVLSPTVFWAGNLQLLLAVATLVLVARGHRWAPLAAVSVGFASAAGFTASHLLPHWSAFSDSFVDGDVDALSWAAALLEIAADLAFGWAGWRLVRRDGIEAAARPRVT